MRDVDDYTDWKEWARDFQREAEPTLRSGLPVPGAYTSAVSAAQDAILVWMSDGTDKFLAVSFSGQWFRVDMTPL